MIREPSFLHVVHDSRFIDAAYRVFEQVAPGRNVFVAFTKTKRLAQIREAPVNTYNHLNAYSKTRIRRIFRSFGVVILHNLTSQKLYVLRALPEHVRVAWLGWGADYYDLLDQELLKPRTRLLRESARRGEVLRRMRVAVKDRLLRHPAKASLLSRIDWFSPVLPEDYRAVRRAQPKFRAEYLAWNYGTLEDDFVRNCEERTVTGPNILLGNSASYTNNHVEAFELLKRIDLSDRKIMVPLSYGDSHYRRVVIEQGRAQFGDRLVPLVRYLSAEVYLAAVMSCSIVVMNHLRQQGVGNIVMMLFLGAKVFLDKANPVYAYFRQQGASVYALEELESEVEPGLSSEALMRNRRVLREVWGRDAILDKTRDMIRCWEGRDIV